MQFVVAFIVVFMFKLWLIKAWMEHFDKDEDDDEPQDDDE